LVGQTEQGHPVRVLVAEKGFGLNLGRQRFRLGDVVSVATGEAERQWIATGLQSCGESKTNVVEAVV